jgi:hypothetical protein
MSALLSATVFDISLRDDIPRSGPTTDAIPKVPPMMPLYNGRLERGVLSAMIMKAPPKMPALPIPGIGKRKSVNMLLNEALSCPMFSPAIALPMIKAIEFGAAPQIALATSKIKIVDRNVHLVLSRLPYVSSFSEKG